MFAIGRAICIASRIILLFVLTLLATDVCAENVLCDPSIDTSIYYCRGWQDGVGKYGSRVRFIARMLGDENGDDYGGKIVSLGDINGDDRGDFSVWVRNQCEWRIYLGDTIISKTPWMIWPRGNGPYPCDTFPGNIAVISDVTGDGFPDLFRAFAEFPPNQKILIYTLGPSFDTLPELILADSAFKAPIGLNGEALVGGFDLNGDGQPDFAFGDGGWTQQSPQRCGRVYVYWGGTALDSIPDLIFTDTCWNLSNEQPYPPGGALTILPPPNGDLYADLVLGRASLNYLKDPVGRADIFFGGPEMDTARDLVMFSPDSANDPRHGYAPSTDYGNATENIGDVNLDGYAELLVSGRGGTPSFIYYGGPTFDTAVDLRLTQPYPTEHGEGRFMTALGDVNGDGHSDFCTVYTGVWSFFRGSVNIHFARSNPSGNVDWTIFGDDWVWAYDAFGRSTKSVGDVDGDGFDDIAIGTRTDVAEEFNEGAVFIFAGYNPDIYSGVFDDPESPLPSDHELIQYVAPNPFNAATTIRLSAGFDSGTIVIYNILGRAVRSFDIQQDRSGDEVKWDGRDEQGHPLASGLYFARAVDGLGSETHKLVLLK